MSRSGLDRCLRRHWVSNLADLRSYEEAISTPVKTFKDYEPGFLRVAVKSPTQTPDEDARTDLFVAIDRINRWVYLVSRTPPRQVRRQRQRLPRASLGSWPPFRSRSPLPAGTFHARARVPTARPISSVPRWGAKRLRDHSRTSCRLTTSDGMVIVLGRVIGQQLQI